MSLVSLLLGRRVIRDSKPYRVGGNLVVDSWNGSIPDVSDVTYGVKAISGIWLLLFLKEQDAQSLAVPDGEPADKLHLTVGAIDPQSARGKRDIINAVIEQSASTLPPVTGKIGGIGQFLTDGENVPVVALFDSPGLNTWRDALLGTLESIGVELLSDHGYTPHVTLRYADEPIGIDLTDVVDREIELPTLSLVWEGERRDYQLTGSEEGVKSLYPMSFDRDGKRWVGPDIDADSFEEARDKIADALRVDGELVAEWELKEQSFTPPESARNNAKRVLRWRDEHPDEIRGMTRVGWTRASQLASGKPISLDTVKRMAQFVRHRKNAEVDPKYESEPWRDAGYVAWLGWGGSTGIDWAKRISEYQSGSLPARRSRT